VSRRAVSEIERRYIAFADLVVTVSDGIARGLERDYNLPVRPVVVRNLPPFSPAARRRANSRRQILFHGLIRPERGIEELIDSARSWAFDGEIVLRGYGSSHYLELLRTRARGVRHDLLVIEQAVPPDELIRRAALSDVGFLALPASTAHYEFALPNKLFEYLMAGLPVLATPREEISRVLEQTGAGLVTELSAEAIAGTLNSLTPEALAAKSAAALAAAPSLSWEAESTKLTDAIALLQVQTA
jgi:glycosyltransferase involved in cell wall biosynthesis